MPWQTGAPAAGPAAAGGWGIDEPSGALDFRTGEDGMELIAALHRRGTTNVLMTDDAAVGGRSQGAALGRPTQLAEQRIHLGVNSKAVTIDLMDLIMLLGEIFLE